MADKNDTTLTGESEPTLTDNFEFAELEVAKSSSKGVALIAAAAFSASANISTDDVIDIARKFEVYLDEEEAGE